MASTWAGTADNETISFNALSNAVSIGYLYQLSATGSTSRQITKSEANTLVRIDTNYAPYAAKTSDQLVYKTDLLPTWPCGGFNNYSGGPGFPITQSITLGTATNDVYFSVNSYNIPDRYIVSWNSSVVIDTGFRGYAAHYDFGGTYRSTFNSSLTGKVDPITAVTYPNMTNYPDDGYPRVIDPGFVYGLTFSKSLSSPTSAIVNVYAPMTATAWEFTLGCPVVSPPPPIYSFCLGYDATGATAACADYVTACTGEL